MRRYLFFSFLFHVGVALGGTLLSPLGSFSTRDQRPAMVINVGLVDLGDKAKAKAGPPSAPKPVREATPKAQPEKVVEPEKKKMPVAEKKIEPAKNKKDEKKEGTEGKDSKELAAKDTTNAITGTISEGSGEVDVWGVEAGPGMSPYHRRGCAVIRSNWRSPVVSPTPLVCLVRFTVNRSGELNHIAVEKSSGSELFDRAAVRAVQITKTWDQFPSYWGEDEQIIHLEFLYQP